MITRILLVAAILFVLTPAPAVELAVSNGRFLLDGKPFKPWGIRLASGVNDSESCRDLISHLDDYVAYGINAITVFYQGSSGGHSNPFPLDGKSVDPALQARMANLIREAGARRMIVVVGIFYQNAPFPFRDMDAVRSAVQTVTENLRPYGNIILNIANEQNSNNWEDSAAICDFRDPHVIINLCRFVKTVHINRLVGGGGYDHVKNEIIGRSSDFDVLLFDTGTPGTDSGALYDRFIKAGVKGKPIMNVETFGGWTKGYLPAGVFSDEIRAAYRREVEAATRIPNLSVFFHNNPWCQGPGQNLPRHYDLGGIGTAQDPGIRWYFEMVRKASGEALR
jgi:hypothetical protein